MQSSKSLFNFADLLLCVSACVRRNAWLALKDEYLQLQKCSMMSLKRCMNKMEQKEQKERMETDNCPPEDKGSESLLWFSGTCS